MKLKKPVSLIIGGEKISTKIKIINNLIKKFDNVVIVGGMANTILKHTGKNVGKSICEHESENMVKQILKIPKNIIVKLLCLKMLLFLKNLME